VGDGAVFTASPTDFRDRTVQGVKFDWESSDPRVLQIDDAGHATFLQWGRVWVTCRAGSASATAPVLIRPGQRQRQNDLEWKLDQAGLDASGNFTGQLRAPQSSTSVAAAFGASGGETTATGLFGRLLDNLTSTAYAQGGGYIGNDFAYDELWSEPRNLIGSPRNRAIEPTVLGAVLLEGSNSEMTIPIIGLGGRGLSASLTLCSNSRPMVAPRQRGHF
jgi:hypothetical protein